VNKQERYIKQFLDEQEKRLLVKFDAWIENVFASIPVGATEEQIHQFHLTQPAALSRLLKQHARHMLMAGQAHGDAEAKDLQRRFGFRLADYPTININEGFTPEEAIRVLDARELVLAGDVEATVVKEIKAILLRHLAGTSPQATQEAIEDLKGMTMQRAALITITESTYAYNRGRLISYRENNVDHVRFSAILDARTSTVCRSRHGLVMRMDDGSLGANTPPLHGHCRSVLVPIYSRYEPDLITEQNTDWSGAAPLPKGWRTG
jgi:SPP1 gp7 family putative phage head morphogenesis protein